MSRNNPPDPAQIVRAANGPHARFAVITAALVLICVLVLGGPRGLSGQEVMSVSRAAFTRRWCLCANRSSGGGARGRWETNMILGLWLDQPMWLMLGLIILFFVTVSAVMFAITALPVTRPTFLRVVDGVVPAFFSSISVLLALLTGFVANDAWERQKLGTRVVEKERANLIAAFDLSIETTSNMAGIRQALLAYTERVIGDEWPKMADGGRSSEAAGAALSNLMRIVADPALTTEAGTVAHTALMAVAMTLRDARGERLALSASKEDDSKWLTLIFLATLTLVSIGMVHGDKHRAQILTLFLFSSAMIVTLSVIALHERPFDGPLAIGPGAIEQAKRVMLAHQANQIGVSTPPLAPEGGGTPVLR